MFSGQVAVGEQTSSTGLTEVESNSGGIKQKEFSDVPFGDAHEDEISTPKIRRSILEGCYSMKVHPLPQE